MLSWGYTHAATAKVCQDVERHAALTLWRRDPMATPGVAAAAAHADVEAREPALA
jgi:hypothetical protein